MRKRDDITRAMERHADTVLRVCTLYFPGRPDCEDAFQETFLKYAQSNAEFKDEEHRKAWLITVARNTCKDLLKRSSNKVVPLDEVDESALALDPSGAESAAGGGVDVIAALQKVEDPYRSILYLKYYEGYRASEIADMLDMPENTVYTNLARGRKKLKEVLAHA